MTHSVRILASLRSAPVEARRAWVDRLAEHGIEGLHLDVMDGRFVDERCFSVRELADLRGRTGLFLDVHLLVAEPAEWIDACLEAGADRIAWHLEQDPDPADRLDRVRAHGRKAGLVVLPSTPLEALDPWLERVDLVNPLGVDPTRGQGFDEATYGRVATLVQRRRARGLDFVVQADGGVWQKTRDGLVEAGADELVGGYPIFSAEDVAAAIAELRGV